MLHEDDAIPRYTKMTQFTFLAVAVVGYRKFRFCSTLPLSLASRGRLKCHQRLFTTPPTQCPCCLTTLLIVFRVVRPPKACAKSKIGELNVTLLINQNIVRFDVSVDAIKI